MQDVIPPAYLEELSLLQDQISPFSTEIAFNTIEQELGLPIDMLFSEISSEPIAAASLGQVVLVILLMSWVLFFWYGLLIQIESFNLDIEINWNFHFTIFRFIKPGLFTADSSLLSKCRGLEFKLQFL